MNIVPQNQPHSELLCSKASNFLDEFHVSRILKSCNAYKVKRVPVRDVIQVAVENGFGNRSFYQKLKEASRIPFAKETFYRLMNSSSINWRKFTLQLGAGIIQKIEPLTGTDRRNGAYEKNSVNTLPSRSHKVFYGTI